MGLTERLIIRFNALLAALFVIGTLGALAWAAAIFIAQVVWWAVGGHWQPVMLGDMLRPMSTVPEPWPLAWIPTVGIQPPADLLDPVWPWVTRTLVWLGGQAAALWLVAIATATAWISSALRVENMRLRAEAARRSRTEATVGAETSHAVAEHAAHA